MSTIYSCHPCNDPYWASFTQFISYELTGLGAGALFGGAISFAMKGEIKKVKTEFKDKIDTWTLVQNSWLTNPINFEPYSQTVHDIQMSVIKGAAVGCALGGLCFYVQGLAKELFCTGYFAS